MRDWRVRAWQPDEAGVLQTDSAVAFYFVTYVILGSITLLNVVVAVLLDEFIATGTACDASACTGVGVLPAPDAPPCLPHTTTRPTAAPPAFLR